MRSWIYESDRGGRAAGDRVPLPGDGANERRTITDDPVEREVFLSRRETAGFLRDLADRLDADASLTIAASGWEIPVGYREPIEVGIEFT